MTSSAYVIITTLYQDAFHHCYLARHTTTGRHVWLKRAAAAHPSIADLDRLQRQCEISQRLSDQGFPCFQAVHRTGDTLECYAEEVSSRGLTLRAWMDAEQGWLDPENILTMMLRLVTMLESFHRHRLLYNLVCPEAIWIDMDTAAALPLDYGYVRDTGVEPDNVYTRLSDIPYYGYLSPELAGQLQQPVDFRSDLYSLGVVLYEMLTGKLPIQADEPIRWLHALITQEAVPPHELNPQVPLPISRIAVKCLAKSPEQRYQSLFALRADLERCLQQAHSRTWSTDTDDEPAAVDIPSTFRISERFVGRKRELQELCTLMDKLEAPGSRLALISGEPGIGKTALVRELQRLREEPGRLFLFGKFDQVHRDLPLQPWIDAFHAWSQYVLALSEDQIAAWKQAIEELIGSGASVLQPLIPQLAIITGRTPPSEQLEGLELLMRYETVFIDFLHVFARMGVSVVVVLDDLQWADPASVKLLSMILEQEELSHLLVVGTYRDGAEEHSSAWREMLLKLERDQRRFVKVRLEAMPVEAAAEWLADTLYCEPAQAWRLAEHLQEITGGNPFFLSECLRMLYHEHQIHYDTDAGRWVWDVQRMTTQGLAHTNVADLLMDRLHHLPKDSLRLLQYAACAGNTFDSDMIARLLDDQDELAAQTAFAELAQLGLIVPDGSSTGAYVFAHDRVRLTSYMLLPEDDRARIHARFGKQLLAAEAPEGSERLYEIVNHLNRAAAYLDEADRKHLIALNLMAGHRAKENTAFDHAAMFYQAGIDLLPDNAWQSDYLHAYALKLGKLECAYLSGHDAESDELFRELQHHAQSLEDRTRVYLTQIQLEARRDRYESAIRLGLKALDELGERIPEHPTRMQLLMEWLRLTRHTFRNGAARLERLAPSGNIRHQAVMELIFALGAPTYVRNPDLMVYLALRSCRLTFKSGIFPNSGIGLVAYGVSHVFMGASIRRGLSMGDIAWRLTLQHGRLADKCYTSFMYGAFLHHWGNPLADSEFYLEQSIAYSIESGNLEFLGYSATHLLVQRHVRGVPLDKLAEEVERYFKWTGRLKDPHFYDLLLLYRHFLRNLRGLTESLYHFDDGDFRETDYADQLSDERKRFDYWLCKVQSLYLLGRWEEAWQAASEAQRMIDAFVGIVNVPEHDYYYCLTLLARWHQLQRSEQSALWRSLKRKRKRFRTWAASCPSHYVHKLKLIEAEMASVRQKDEEAVVRYREAVEAATKHAYMQNAAIASECAARHYLRRNNQQEAERHLYAAYQSYLAWGAKGKAGLLLRQFPRLADHRGAEGSALQSQLPHSVLTEALDVSAVAQASQAISQEIVLEDLLRQLLLIVMQHSGADRIVLLLERQGEWAVAASGTADAKGTNYQLLAWTPWHDDRELPHTVIEYVDRTGELLVLDDAGLDQRFGGDQHIARRGVQSLLCMPMVQRGKTAGLLYLENSQTGGVFTPRKVELLKLLSSQIAISLQNAMMYDRLRAANTELEGAYAETAITLEHTQREAAGTMIEKVILEERSRIAGDIHDTIGHTLTSVLLQLEIGKKLLNKKSTVSEALTKLDNSQQLLREGLQQLRKTLTMLEEGDSGEQESIYSLETFIQQTMDYTGIRIQHEIAPDIQLSASQKYVLYRALQEGITNGIRHGGADRFDFALKRSDAMIEFVLRDNGRGSPHITPGFGLSAMMNRVHELGGRIEIYSREGEGSTLMIWLPLADLTELPI